jgi:lipoate-protein ligase A
MNDRDWCGAGVPPVAMSSSAPNETAGDRSSGLAIKGSDSGTGEILKSPNLQTSKSPILQSLISHPSSFILLLDPPASGPWNMAVDEVLLEAAATEGQCTLRFYQWDEPTLSLGYFQDYNDRWQHEPSRHSPVVRRTSGGGAIMHHIELTYSFAVTSNHPLARNRLGFYQAVHTTLIETLAQWGVKAVLFSRPEEKQNLQISKSPNRESPFPIPPSPLVPQPFLCFQRRSPGDVLVGDVKIAGSAQRRSQGAVLQHGSVLLARSPAAPELDGIQELVDTTIGAEQLAEAWLDRLGQGLPMAWQRGGLSDEQIRHTTDLSTRKYASDTWTVRRGRA